MIFTVNPGATTTKCGIYSFDLKELWFATIEHPDSEIKRFQDVSSQVDYREEKIRQILPCKWKISACAGRGGMLTPVPSGAIKINQSLVDFSLKTPVYQHASNLGAPLAFRIATSFNVPSFIVDPVSVDELPEHARISGCPELPRFSFVHALNVRATSRLLAKKLGKGFNKIRCVVAHLGGGFSIAAVKNGHIVDNDNRMESASFTPERAGGVPPIPLVELCFSGKYSKEEILKKLYGEGGLYAYLRTKDVRQILSKIEKGDKKSALVYSAMIYQICKEIGAMASVLDFRFDGIILTGGLANSSKIVSDIRKKIKRLGPVFVYSGSNENMALAMTVAQVLKKKEKYREWPL